MKKIVASVNVEFQFDVTDWVKEDGEKEVYTELHDFSVFMPKAEYKNFNSVEVELIHSVENSPTD